MNTTVSNRVGNLICSHITLKNHIQMPCPGAKYILGRSVPARCEKVIFRFNLKESISHLHSENQCWICQSLVASEISAIKLNGGQEGLDHMKPWGSN